LSVTVVDKLRILLWMMPEKESIPLPLPKKLGNGRSTRALAMIYPEPEKGGRGKVGATKEAKKLGGFSDERLRQARAVLRLAKQRESASRTFQCSCRNTW